MIVYLNGELLPKAEARVPIEDRGFVFGDGVYEVWRVVRGALFEHDRHMARLLRGLAGLQIAPPAEASSGRMAEIADRLISDNHLEDGEATLYLEITRGVAPRVHQFPDASTRPTVFALAKAFVPPLQLRADGVSAITVPDIRWHRCDLKTIQLLPNVMAKQQAAERNAFEAIFVRDGVVTEGSHSNLMAVIDGELRTHPADNHILAGITRDVLLEMARADGIIVRETAFRDDDLGRASELMLTGTATDLTPIVRVDERTVGGGKPGPVARRLTELLAMRMYAPSSRASVAAGR